MDKTEFIKMVSSDASLLNQVPLELRMDKAIIRAAINTNANVAFREMFTEKDNYESEFWDILYEKDIIMDSFTTSNSHFSYIPPELRLDKDVVLKACSVSGGNILEYISPQLKQDKDVVMAAVSRNGLELEFLCMQIRDEFFYYTLAHDEDVIRAAISQNGHALKFVPLEMKTKEIIFMAIQQTPNAVAHIRNLDIINDPLFIRQLTVLLPSFKGFEDEEEEDQGGYDHYEEYTGDYEGSDEEPIVLSQAFDDSIIQPKVEEILLRELVIITIQGHQIQPHRDDNLFYSSDILIERHANTNALNYYYANKGTRDTDKRHRNLLTAPGKSDTDDVVFKLDKLMELQCKENGIEYHLINLFITCNLLGDKIISCESHDAQHNRIGELDDQIIIRGNDVKGNPFIHNLTDIKPMWSISQIMTFARNLGAPNIVLYDFSTPFLSPPRLSRQLSILKTNQETEGTCYAHTYARIILQNAISKVHPFVLTQLDNQKFNKNKCNRYLKTNIIIDELTNTLHPGMVELNEELCSVPGYEKIILFLCIYFNIKTHFSCAQHYISYSMFKPLTMPSEITIPKIVSDLSRLVPPINDFLSRMHIVVVRIYVHQITPINLFYIVKQVTDLNFYVALGMHGHLATIVGTEKEKYIIKNSWSKDYDVVPINLSKIFFDDFLKADEGEDVSICIPVHKKHKFKLTHSKEQSIENKELFQFELWLEKYRQLTMPTFNVSVILPDKTSFTLPITALTPVSYLRMKVAQHTLINENNIYFTQHEKQLLFYEILEPGSVLQTITLIHYPFSLNIDKVGLSSQVKILIVNPDRLLSDIKAELEATEHFLEPNQRIYCFVYDGKQIKDYSLKISDILMDETKPLNVSVEKKEKGGTRKNKKRSKRKKGKRLTKKY
jgi:hypothetical protein